MEVTNKSDKKVENILEFPNEILEHIFKFVEKHGDLSFVCRRFHQISCNVKFYELNSKHFESDFDGVLETNRRFDALKMDEKFDIMESKDSHFAKVFQVLDVIGSDIRKLSILQANRSLEAEKLNELFAFLPNLEKISVHFRHIYQERNNANAAYNPSRTFVDARLLPKLKELNILESNLIFNIFSSLTSNTVLRKLTISSFKFLREEKLKPDAFFFNQTKLREIGMCTCSQSFFYTEAFQSLSKLDVEVHSSDNQAFIEWVPKLPNLQELSVVQTTHGYKAATIELMGELSSSSMKTLVIRFPTSDIPLSVSTLKSFGEKFPRLENIKFLSVVRTLQFVYIAQHCPIVKHLSFYDLKSETRDISTQIVGLNHSLESLKVGHGPCPNNCQMWQPFISEVIGNCSNLTWFEAPRLITKKSFIHLLSYQPNLKTLVLPHAWRLLSFECIDALLAHGKKLENFVCDGEDYSSFKKPQFTQERFQSRLGSLFRSINFEVVTSKETFGTDPEDEMQIKIPIVLYNFKWRMHNYSNGFVAPIDHVLELGRLPLIHCEDNPNYAWRRTSS